MKYYTFLEAGGLQHTGDMGPEIPVILKHPSYDRAFRAVSLQNLGKFRAS